MCAWLAAAAGCTSAQETPADYAGARVQLAESLTRPIFGRKAVESESVLDAIRTVPRHAFVPPEYREFAYEDRPLPIGHDQTISQPYIVAIMTEAIALRPTDRVLEIGTGSGYQAAVLGELAAQVYTIEIVETLGLEADSRLKALGYENVEVRIGDGYKGWPERAPFDAIMVTAAPDHVPQPLVDQLRPGGRMVIPVGAEREVQELLLITRSDSGEVSQERLELVRFVPMTGEARDR